MPTKVKTPTRKPLRDVNEALGQIHRDGLCVASREIWLHSIYGGDEEPGVEYRMATSFIKNMNVLEKEDPTKPILIHMHITGGEWNDGMAIFDTIKMSRCKTTIIGYAQASSMSGIILQSANTRLLMPNCEFMAHSGTVDQRSESRTALTVAERNMQSHDLMLDIFAQRVVEKRKLNGDKGPRLETQRAKQDIEIWIKDKGEINILAPAAVDFGFADAVIGDPKYPTVYDVWNAMTK